MAVYHISTNTQLVFNRFMDTWSQPESCSIVQDFVSFSTVRSQLALGKDPVENQSQINVTITTNNEMRVYYIRALPFEGNSNACLPLC